jgi:hypothetical protein
VGGCSRYATPDTAKSPVLASLTKTRRQAVLDAVRAGADRRGAAGAAGVNPRTLQRWMEEDPTLAAEMEAAEGRLIAELVSVVVNASTGRVADHRKALGKLGTRMGTGDPDMALRLLSTRYPEVWGRRRVELTGADGGPIQTEQVEYRDKLRAQLDELAARRERRKAG